jgi:hypothetical protein
MPKNAKNVNSFLRLYAKKYIIAVKAEKNTNNKTNRNFIPPDIFSLDIMSKNIHNVNITTASSNPIIGMINCNSVSSAILFFSS